MPRLLSALSFLALASAFWPLSRFVAAARGTALRSASAWALIAAAGWGSVALLSALEPAPTACSLLGLARLGAAPLLLAPLISVLGARWPGARAWNLIVLSLLGIFLLPVLEQAVLRRPLEGDRVGMDGPRFAIYWLAGAVGIANYVPTRFGVASLCLAVAMALASYAVGPWTVGRVRVSECVALAGLVASGAVWLAYLVARRPMPAGLDGAWIRFRDAWGLVWAGRFRDRWNAEAKRLGWPVRLTWRGFRSVEHFHPIAGALPHAAEQQFWLQMRRFARSERLMGR